MDEKVLKIVAKRLKTYEGQPINEEKLIKIRSDVFSATKTNKFASFANVKKWVKAARKLNKNTASSQSKSKQSSEKIAKGLQAQAKIKEKLALPDEIPKVSKSVEDSLNFIKEEVVSPQMQEVLLPKATVVFDKVYLQSIKFEIAGIRQAIERMNRQLERLEKELSEHVKED